MSEKSGTKLMMKVTAIATVTIVFFIAKNVQCKSVSWF